MERRLLGAPTPVERITYHAHSAPLHKIKTDNMLPSQLLTPFQVSFCIVCIPDVPRQLFVCSGRRVRVQKAKFSVQCSSIVHVSKALAPQLLPGFHDF